MLKTLLNSRSLPNEPFLMNITSPDNLGRRRTTNSNIVFQLTAGLEGRIPGTDWTWEFFGTHGESTARTDLDGLIAINRWRAVVTSPNYGRAFDVTANDGVVGNKRNGARATCATGLSPFDPSALWSADCRDAIGTSLQTNNRVSQDNAEANLQGGLFDLPYGQIRFALGASYRRNALNYRTDSTLADGSSFIESVGGVFPQGDTIASITAKEVYGELFVPVLADLPFVKALNLELGYRLSDYDTIGAISTYKLNGEYAPFGWLRFRGGYQRASRAPNLVELFSAPAQAFGASAEGDPCSRANPYQGPTSSPFPNYSANPIGLDSELNPNTTDTFGNPDAAKVEALCRQLMGTTGADVYYAAGRTYNNGTAISVPQVTIGNPNLNEEKATTYTIGAVLTSPLDSPWLRQLRASVDYYNVVLADGISLQSADGIYRRCFSSVYNPDYEMNEFCALVDRSTSTGEPETIGITWSNAGRVQTSGIDAQVDWGLNFKDVNIGLPGSIRFNSQFTYLLEFATTTDAAVLPLRDWAGTFGGGEVGTNAGSYKWRLINNYSYTVGPLNVSLQWQHRPATKASTAVSSANNTFSGAPAYDLFSLSGTFTVMRAATLRFGVDNLFDKAPPIYNINSANTPESGLLPGGTINTAYDVLGRRFYMGVRYKF
jgi:iron complex outermembrane recepter protein